MAYIEPEVIEQARQIDLLTYLQAFEPGELVDFIEQLYYSNSRQP